MVKERYKVWAILILILIVLIMGAVGFYIFMVNDMSSNDVDRYLEGYSTEVSSKVKAIVESRQRNAKVAFNSISYMQNKNYFDVEEIKNDYFKSLECYGLVYFSTTFDASFYIFLDEEGNVNSGNLDKNKLGDKWFHKIAMQKKENFEIDNNFAFFSSAIVSNQNVVTDYAGVFYKKDDIEKALRVNLYSGNAIVSVCKKNGDGVFDCTDTQNDVKYNVFEYLSSEEIGCGQEQIDSFKSKFINNQNGKITYFINKKEHRIYYQAMTINDWIIVTDVGIDDVREIFFNLGSISIVIAVSIGIALFLLYVVFVINNVRFRRKIERGAFVDSVTGGVTINKMNLFMADFFQNNKDKISVMISLDVKDFKLINQMHGKKVGDSLLKYIHMKIKEVFSPYVFCRSNSDKFLCLCDYRTKDELSNKLEKFVNEVNLFNNSSVSKNYTSFACGLFIVDDASLSIDEMQERANLAKENNNKIQLPYNSNYSFYENVANKKILFEKQLENSMEDALKNNEFKVYLQPKFKAVVGGKRSPVGAEALVRWDSKTLGFISPISFIPLFESNGFIEKLDLYIFETVCKRIRKWVLNDIKVVPVSINMSNETFLRGGIRQYEKILQKYKVPPKCIEFEFTESVIFADMAKLTDAIKKIHKMECLCALDDFGSGYSAFNVLKDLPVDTIKLDKAFFDKNGKDSVRGKSIIKSVIDLAKGLKMKTVAEGIETVEQVKFLEEMGCDQVQGYVFEKPLPILQFENKYAVTTSLKKVEKIKIEEMDGVVLPEDVQNVEESSGDILLSAKQIKQLEKHNRRLASEKMKKQKKLKKTT